MTKHELAKLPDYTVYFPALGELRAVKIYNNKGENKKGWLYYYDAETNSFSYARSHEACRDRLEKKIIEKSRPGYEEEAWNAGYWGSR